MLRTARTARQVFLVVVLGFTAACQSGGSGQSHPGDGTSDPTATETSHPEEQATGQGALRFRAVSSLVPSGHSSEAPPPSTSGFTDTGAQPGEIERAKQIRQNVNIISDSAAQQAAIASLDCTAPDPLHGHDDPDLPLVTCDQDDTAIYVLEPAFLTGDHIADASAAQNPQGTGYVVHVSFKPEGRRIWGDFTTDNINRQVAFVLDTEVVSAPSINEPILGGTTEITGRFSQQAAEKLAAQLGN